MNRVALSLGAGGAQAILPRQKALLVRCSPMLNKLYIGFDKDIKPPKGGFLFIDDEVPDIPRARIFDPAKHSFNPLKNIDYKKAREVADILYTVSPQGENTLTVRNGKRSLLAMLLEGKERLDKLGAGSGAGAVEAAETVNDVLASPVLRRVLCNPTNFSFNPRSVILARVNRAELGDFDALVLGLLLMAQYKGTVCVPDFGFYGRDLHASLIRQNRLIAGVYTLAELSPKLRQNVLLIRDKVPCGTTFEDAVILARYKKLEQSTVGFNDFVKEALG